MRCNNCGWSNDERALVCIKCNIGLEKIKQKNSKHSKSSNKEFISTISENPMSTNLQNFEQVLIKSIPGIAESTLENKAIDNEMLASCTKCGYLNALGAVVCAKCKTPLFVCSKNNLINNSPIVNKESFIKNNSSESGFEILQTINNTVEEKTSNNASANSTIDPYHKSKEIEKCHFTPILRKGEIKNYPDYKINNILDKNFKSDINPNQLNRSNLDEQNLSITSKVQAELSYEDGKWFLQDKSEQQTTSILAKEKIALKEGDIILMGDRKFTFSMIDKF